MSSQVARIFHLYITNKSINTWLKSASPTPAERRNFACGPKLIGV